ncbi:MAG: hypothetical protein OXL41_02970 [Nitrospinae bacterium]|nr:hypothetical protein [Nitrospinota bacterium]
MKQTNERLGRSLAKCIGELISPSMSHPPAKSMGYIIPFLFGGRKASVRLMAELFILYSAIIYDLVNAIYDLENAKEIIDAYLSESVGRIVVIEKQEQDFTSKFAEKIPEYIKIMDGSNPMIGVSRHLMKGLGMNPVYQENQREKQLAAAAWIGESKSAILDVFRPSVEGESL